MVGQACHLWDMLQTEAALRKEIVRVENALTCRTTATGDKCGVAATFEGGVCEEDCGACFKCVGYVLAAGHVSVCMGLRGLVV